MVALVLLGDDRAQHQRHVRPHQGAEGGAQSPQPAARSPAGEQPGLLLVLSIGCSGKTIQYKDDHDRILRIDQAVELLRKSYVERDRNALEGLLLPSGNLDQVQREIQSDFDTFQSIQLEFSIERILIEGDNIDVFVHWQGQWKRTPGEVGTRQRGHGRLAWVGTQSILLREAQGDLPFGMGSRVNLSEDPARSAPKP